MSDHWPHFEHSHLVTLGKQLSGSVPCFENTRHFRAWVNHMTKSIKHGEMHIFQPNSYTRESSQLSAATKYSTIKVE